MTMTLSCSLMTTKTRTGEEDFDMSVKHEITINGKSYTEAELRRGYRVVTGLDDEDLTLEQLIDYMTDATKEDREVCLSDLRAIVESFESFWDAAKAARTRTTGAYAYLTDVLAASSYFTNKDWKQNMLAACELVVFNFGLSKN